MNDDLKKKAVTVTLSPMILKKVDRVMREIDRTRSWVVNEALRKFFENDGGMDVPEWRDESNR